MQEYILKRTQIVPSTLENTFSFFSDAQNLARITPKELGFNILTPLPLEMKTGTIIDYRIKVKGIPLHWRTLIEDWVPNKKFVDLQLKGPYALWHHTHEFKAIKGGVGMTDTVRYRLPFGPVGSLVHPFFVEPELKRIFDYRAKTINEFFSS